MGHRTLTRLVASPARPIDAGGDWTVPEIALSVRLPEDYKWLVGTYGWGSSATSSTCEHRSARVGTTALSGRADDRRGV
jgi:hypothetical protein